MMVNAFILYLFLTLSTSKRLLGPAGKSQALDILQAPGTMEILFLILRICPTDVECEWALAA